MCSFAVEFRTSFIINISIFKGQGSSYITYGLNIQIKKWPTGSIILVMNTWLERSAWNSFFQLSESSRLGDVICIYLLIYVHWLNGMIKQIFIHDVIIIALNSSINTTLLMCEEDRDCRMHNLARLLIWEKKKWIIF